MEPVSYHPRHGGDLSAARRAFGSPPSGWLDLSTGVNPWPYPHGIIRPETLTRLPQDDAMEALLAAARHAYGIPQALEVMWRDGGTHRSFNAGHPEASMAGALGLRLAGPRRYQGFVTDDPWLGDGSIDATAADIRRGLRVYVGACLLLAVLMAGLWAASRLLAGMPLP